MVSQVDHQQIKLVICVMTAGEHLSEFVSDHSKKLMGFKIGIVNIHFIYTDKIGDDFAIYAEKDQNGNGKELKL